MNYVITMGLPLWLRGEESAFDETCFDPWVKKIPWRRKWQPSPVLLPGKSHGQRSLVGYSPWDCKESDTTERLHLLMSNYKVLGNRSKCFTWMKLFTATLWHLWCCHFKFMDKAGSTDRLGNFPKVTVLGSGVKRTWTWKSTFRAKLSQGGIKLSCGAAVISRLSWGCRICSQLHHIAVSGPWFLAVWFLAGGFIPHHRNLSH